MSAPAADVATPGTLYLVPTPLDFGCEPQPDVRLALPQATLAVAARLTHWITENAKSTRAFLKRVQAVQPLAAPLPQQTITELPRAWHKHGDAHAEAEAQARQWLTPARHGHDIGLVSEAGMPAIADPGAAVVRAAHALGLRVVPLTGPVSLMLALAASGCHGQRFAFVGYLPQDAAARLVRLRELEATARRLDQAQLFIETPYRNRALLQAALQALKPDTRLAVACGLGLPTQAVHSARVADWRRQPPTLPLDLPAVFVLGH
ncbi:Ribosomal RNA small subunit methyltransferase I [Tepidimonas thermarum]|uniref:Ribosomal RNA small subunit methyltransferase I n=1 Tax=Tepidimonas thermarum TaxID=335431 RepID=A0A554WYC2_9BURK|nr:SAM-dependent methyltransferase [Tepidimonas thermarum]TSE28582.1 Ribosomal RNA small subunit methyltransferase I [Tepidimonas thermarum]